MFLGGEKKKKERADLLLEAEIKVFNQDSGVCLVDIVPIWLEQI